MTFKAPSSVSIATAVQQHDANHGTIGSGKDGLGRSCNGICKESKENFDMALVIPEVTQFYENNMKNFATIWSMNKDAAFDYIFITAFILGVMAGQVEANTISVTDDRWPNEEN